MARFEADPMVEADRAEQAGDYAAATAALRRHLGAAPSDLAARMRYARLLATCGERAAARRELEALDPNGLLPDAITVEANRLLAELDESEGALGDAALRWERLLADDIDDPQARAQLRRLRASDIQPPAEGAAATLVSPEGVEMLRYRLLRELGRGTTAAVYLARDQVLDIPIALKVLHPQLAGPSRSEARRQFFAEARLAAALRHPGVIAIYDLDETARTLSMEYVPGGTLRARLRLLATMPATATTTPGNALSAEEVLATTRSLLAALGYVHGQGIAHGDLKPSNLLLRAPGAVVLADFGIARLITGALPAPGLHDAPAGTPLYLAPEQFQGAPASQATDLYATGAILWEMLMGRPLRDQNDLVAGGFHTAAPVDPAVIARLGPVGTAVGEVIAGLTRRLASERISSASRALARLSFLPGPPPSIRS
jgi:serine/threonine protein kinase